MLAFLMTFIFISLYNQQLDALVDEQAEALANEIAQTAFASLSGGQAILPLPSDVGGSPYTIEVQENSIFLVRITGGRRAGSEYGASVNATVVVEDGGFSPGGRVYFMRSGDVIIMSASPITALPGDFEQPIASTPPDFYRYFARYKENAKAATAITATYFSALENYTNIDVTGYAYDGDDVLVQISYKGGGNLFGIRVSGENGGNVGWVDNSWIVNTLTITDNLTSALTSPSVENAASGGWLYSPLQALEQLRERTWRRASDNAIVTVPSTATIRAAAATTNVSTYPTWRVEWQSDNYYVIHIRAMPWWENDEMPGFIFQSTPELYPVV
jgi:hypothetical protein